MADNNELEVEVKIGLSDEDKQKMADEIYDKVNNETQIELDKMHETIQSFGQLRPAGTDTSTNILNFKQNKGIYVATDNGYWYYWNGSAYVYGGIFQTREIADKSVTPNKTSFYKEKEGLNILKLEDTDEIVKSGLTYSIKNGVVTLNGTTTGWVVITLSNKLFPTGWYCGKVFGEFNNIALNFKNSETGNIIIGFNSSFPNYGFGIETTEQINLIQMSIAPDVTFNNYELKLMLVRSNIMPTRFEPYTINYVLENDYTNKINLPILYLNGDIKSMTKEEKVTLNYVYGNLSGTCTLKWQGNSSIMFPKKNYTIKFDDDFEAKSGWGSQKKYVLKANWVDPSHSRNIVTCKLWGDVVKSRTNVPTELVGLINGGAIDGFPIWLKINNEDMGLFTFNIPKDGWMFGMGNLTTEAIVGAGGSSEETNWNSTPIFDENHFEIEYAPDEDNTTWIETSITNLYNAIQNATAENYETVLAPHLDIDSAIDYFILCALTHNYDGIDHNWLLATFNGVKWHYSVYDVDCVFGSAYLGTAFVSAKDILCSFEEVAKRNKLVRFIFDNLYDKLINRYKFLVNTYVSEDAVFNKFYNYTKEIPQYCYDKDREIWTTLPSTSVNNLTQITSWYGLRIKVFNNIYLSTNLGTLEYVEGFNI